MPISTIVSSVSNETATVIQLLNQQNGTEIWLAIATFLAVGVAAVGIILKRFPHSFCSCVRSRDVVLKTDHKRQHHLPGIVRKSLQYYERGTKLHYLSISLHTRCGQTGSNCICNTMQNRRL